MVKKTGLIVYLAFLLPGAAPAQVSDGFSGILSSSAVNTGSFINGSQIPEAGVFVQKSSGTPQAAAAEAGAQQTAVPPAGAEVSTETRKLDLTEFEKYMDADMKVTAKSNKIYEGTSDSKKTYRINVPKGVHWRILWKAEGSDKKQDGRFYMEVTSPADDKYHQGVVKDLKMGGGGVGMIYICLTTTTDFDLRLEAKKTKWRVEVQML